MQFARVMSSYGPKPKKGNVSQLVAMFKGRGAKGRFIQDHRSER